MVLWNSALHCNLFRMQWFCNLPIWTISRAVAYVLFVYTPIQFKMCLIIKKSSVSSGNCKCKNSFAKIFPFGKIGFFQLLNNLLFVGDDNQDHALTFNVLYWGGNATKNRVNKARFIMPLRLRFTVFRTSPLFVHFSSFHFSK